MSPKPIRVRVSTLMMAAFLGFLPAALLSACSAGAETPELETPTVAPSLPPTRTSPPDTLMPSNTPTEQPTKTAVKPATLRVTPFPTATATELWVPTPFTNSLEAFGMVYDPQAKLEIPPWGSVSMLFWGQEIPVRPIQSTPEFISYPTPEAATDSLDLLIEAGCQLDPAGDIYCPPESALSSFGCFFVHDPERVDAGLQPHIPLVAGCAIMTEEHEAAKAGGLYLDGCAFKFEIHYIFEIENEYVLVSSVEELKDLLFPLDSPDEAVSYAQMVTGLEAVYGFSFDPTLMYFDERIEGTQVTQTESGYEMTLFHFAGCGCEPWFTSRITLQVDREGGITWMDAAPVFMTTGWGCAD